MAGDCGNGPRPHFVPHKEDVHVTGSQRIRSRRSEPPRSPVRPHRDLGAVRRGVHFVGAPAVLAPGPHSLAFLLIFGGIFSFLPILGVWMLPLGFLILALDIPPLQGPVVSTIEWVERKWAEWKNRKT
jgi:hypothetical protein